MKPTYQNLTLGLASLVIVFGFLFPVGPLTTKFMSFSKAEEPKLQVSSDLAGTLVLIPAGSFAAGSLEGDYPPVFAPG